MDDIRDVIPTDEMVVEDVEAIQHSPFDSRPSDVTQRCRELAMSVPISRPLLSDRPLLELKVHPIYRVRLRYKTESASGGLIYGRNSTPEKNTFVTIRINNYVGKVLIVVSCVDKDDHKAHPYKLTGHKGCSDTTGGACFITSTITANSNEYAYNNLGILLIKRNDIESSLEERKKVGVDPYKQGFGHAKNASAINRKALRLAFEVYAYEPNGRLAKHAMQLARVTSDVIHHEKDLKDPEITHCSHSSMFVSGGLKIFMFCKTVTKDTVAEFCEKNEANKVTWSSIVDPWFTGKDGYIVEAPQYNPRYYNPETHTSPIKVWLRLFRKETRQYSTPLPLEYLPTPGDKTKRKRVNRQLEESYDLVKSISNHDISAEACEWYRRSKEEREPITTPQASALPIQSRAPDPVASPFCTPVSYENLAYNEASTSYQASAYGQVCSGQMLLGSHQLPPYSCEQDYSPYQASINNKAMRVLDTLPGPSLPSTQLIPHLAPPENQTSSAAYNVEMPETHDNTASAMLTSGSLNPLWDHELESVLSPDRNHLGSLLYNLTTDEPPVMTNRQPSTNEDNL